MARVVQPCSCMVRSTPAAALSDMQHTPLFSQREKNHKEVKWVAERKQGQGGVQDTNQGRRKNYSCFPVLLFSLQSLYFTVLHWIICSDTYSRAQG